MAAKGDLIYASALNADILAKGECGGAVTALLKYALESRLADGVLTVEKGVDLYDAKPVFITDSALLINSAGSLHCGTLLIPKLIKKYFNGARDLKIAVTLKGCDAKAMYELAKREQINLDNIIMIGLNCGGSLSPVPARNMISKKYGIDPDCVFKEEFDKGKFIIEYDGGEKGISVNELEEEGYGRCLNCQRCMTKIPRQCDLACGNWGVVGDGSKKATFIEICSEKGANLVTKAESAGAICVSDAPESGIAVRSKIEKTMLLLAGKAREKQFAMLGSGKERLNFIMEETSMCIKCYQCIEKCPVCYCVECSTKKPYFVPPGKIPPPFMFHLIRYSHIADSCINCGQCEELCAMDIPNSLFMHAIQVEMEEMFGYVPGEDLGLPVLALVEESQERKRLLDTGCDQIFDIFKK